MAVEELFNKNNSEIYNKLPLHIRKSKVALALV